MPKRTLNPTPATAFFPPDHPIPCPFFFFQGVRHDLQLSPLRCIGTPDWTHPFSLELSAILIDPRYLPDYPVLLSTLGSRGAGPLRKSQCTVRSHSKVFSGHGMQRSQTSSDSKACMEYTKKCSCGPIEFPLIAAITIAFIDIKTSRSLGAWRKQVYWSACMD